MTIIFDGVDPVRLKSVLERKRVLEAYCAIEKPTGRQTSDHAASLGMQQSQFYNLVRAWKLRSSPSDIIGAQPPKQRKPRIDQRVVDIIGQAINNEGPEASIGSVSKEVKKSCAKQQLAMPSRNTIQERIMKARSVRQNDDPRPRNIAFQARFEIPVNHRGEIKAPHIAGILQMPIGTITHFQILIGAPADIIRVVEDFLATMDAGDDSPPVLASGKVIAQTRNEFRPRLRIRPKDCTGSALIGRVLGGQSILHLNHPKADEKLERKVRAGLNNALSPTEAITAVEDAIAKHNAATQRALSDQSASEAT